MAIIAVEADLDDHLIEIRKMLKNPSSDTSLLRVSRSAYYILEELGVST